MTATIDAVYEHGCLRLLEPLKLPEHTRVRVSVETLPAGTDAERNELLAQSERTLMKVWDKPHDDVFNELLKK